MCGREQGFEVRSDWPIADLDAVTNRLQIAGIARSRAGARHLMSDPVVAQLAERTLAFTALNHVGDDL
jgi:hypothetical protein